MPTPPPQPPSASAPPTPPPGTGPSAGPGEPSPGLAGPRTERSAPPRPTIASALEAKPTRPTGPAALPVNAPAAGPTPTRPPSAEPHGSHREGLTVPMPWVYWIATGAVVLFATVWWGGVLAGKKDAERRFGKALSNENRETTPADPQAGPSEPPPAPAPIPTPAPEAKDPPAAAGGDLYGGSGWTDADPRQKGLNYLRLATLPKSDAVRVVDYLKGKGKAALAVPSRAVERGPDAGKNPGYFVYLLTALTRDQYRDGKTAVRIENEVKAIGKDWQKSKDRGPTDFAQPGWVKFE